MIFTAFTVAMWFPVALAAPKKVASPAPCGPKSAFEEVAVVVGAAGEKVPLGTGKAYVIPGDVVRVAKAAGDETCVAYPGPGPKEVFGRVATKSLSVLDAANPELAKLADATPLPHAAWAGEWLRGKDAGLTITAPAGAGILVNGDAAAGQNVGEIKGQEFVVKGRTAIPATKQTEDSVPCDGLKLYRFQNALFATEAAPCGGLGVTFQGAYFRNSERRSKK